MRNILNIELSLIQNNEEFNDSNIRLDRYEIPNFCPSTEVECYQVILEKGDLERIFILFESGFNNLTNNNTFRLSDLIPDEAQKKSRVLSFLDDRDFDLCSRPERTIILFGTNLETSSLTAMDGNHRLMAHFINNNNIDGVPAFIYIHRKINKFIFTPPLARLF